MKKWKCAYAFFLLSKKKREEKITEFRSTDSPWRYWALYVHFQPVVISTENLVILLTVLVQKHEKHHFKQFKIILVKYNGIFYLTDLDY